MDFAAFKQGKTGIFGTGKLDQGNTAHFEAFENGYQWRELCIREYFEGGAVTWQGVYYYFNKWSRDGSFKRAWISLLSANRARLDPSTVQLDGSHTPAKNGGAAVGYQGRKSCKTSNSLFLCDNQGRVLAVSTPQSGEHNDLFEIKALFEELVVVLKEAGIESRWLFVNADPGFDSEAFREAATKRWRPT